jgi:glycosyltransferase involved in cell wall biosynthesis
MVDRKISLCITNYNRDTLLFESFRYVLDDDRVSEIVIADDQSDVKIFNKVKEHCDRHQKIKLHRNFKNLGCYKNKRRVIELASNDWVIIFDSDNVLKKDYIDALYSVPEWSPATIYAPEFARPHFSYIHFAGQTIDKSNVARFVGQPKFDCLINCMNYFVNRGQYLLIHDNSGFEPWTADTIYMNHRWFKAHNKMHVLKGLQYDHLIHKGSHYQQHNNKTGNLFKDIENQLKMMR